MHILHQADIKKLIRNNVNIYIYIYNQKGSRPPGGQYNMRTV